MFTLFVILTILTSLLLIGVVLIQKSKGGGLSSSFAGSNQIMGVRRTNNFIEKVTWGLAGAIAVFAILSSYTMPSGAIQSTPRVQAAILKRRVAASAVGASLFALSGNPVPQRSARMGLCRKSS